MSVALLTPDEARDDWGVETDMADSALQSLLESESAALLKAVPLLDDNTVVETRQPLRDEQVIVLAMDAASVESVTEAGETTLVDDYQLQGLRSLVHLSGGWHAPVVIAYTPVSAAQLRDQLKARLIQLVRLWIAYNGNQSFQSGDFGARPLDYTTERQALLDEVGGVQWLLM